MNLYRSIMFAALGWICTTASAYPDQIFKQFSYDETLEESKKKAKVYSCEGDYGPGMHCVDDVSLFDVKFVGILSYEDGKLKKVVLGKDEFDSSFAKVIPALSNTFQLISISSKNGDIDLISLRRESSDKNDYLSKVSSFERAAHVSGHIQYIFIEGSKDDVYRTKNATDAIVRLPASSRTVTVIFDDQEGVALSFEFPKRYIIEMNKLKSSDAEKF